ncbi:cytochrome c oxidase subunit II [Acuticoccus sp. M5D2P5]|uniref:cytochrome c oxidase subunit II n=1 Tax=Acuticoccus kalidii TaxID=2910977 RepID=UPI001F2FAA82|nr:cytochrome c oxidase subunit II [Acuticoccus kalidii]MCF3933509.1 cytochrome c oxidase subunit II [Acuticoccus kalidii]
MRRALAKGGLLGTVMLSALLGLLTVAEAAQPEPWGIGMQAAATGLAEQVFWFERYTLWIITAIVIFVLGLLLWVIVRYNHRSNPKASSTAHNTVIEVVWTIVPVLILVMIAFPSFRLLFAQTTIPTPDLTIKAIGGQWYWNYEYVDPGMEDIKITSYMLDDDQRSERMEQYGMNVHDVPRLLAVDYPIVAPAGATVQVLVTSLDVNHAWTVPSFGIKRDAIPGRLNETWFKAGEPGVYYGQCSELCGRQHAFMPIEVHIVTPERFEEWSTAAKEDLDAANDMLLTWQAESSEPAVASLATTN